MIKNIYYLIVGILSVLFSFTHAQNGANTILKETNTSNFSPASKTTIFYVWHIITAENLIFGIFFIIMALYKNQTQVKFAAWLILIVIAARWCAILAGTLIMSPGDIGNTLIDSIAIIVFAALIIFGIRKKENSEPEVINR
jgi:hypothetical protein